MVAADDPVLAFCLVVDRSAVGVVPPQSHTGSYEYAIYLVAHKGDRGHVRERDVVESSHCRTAESASRGLVKVIALAGLVIQYGNPAVGVTAEFVLGCRVGISPGIIRSRRNDAYVERLVVGLPHYLVKRAVVVPVEGSGG